MKNNSKNDLLQLTSKSIWCAQANIFIAPWQPVDKAFITRGYADRSRYWNKAYLAIKTVRWYFFVLVPNGLLWLSHYS